MVENGPQPPWYRKWIWRSLLLIAVGLAMLLGALWIPPTQEFDPDLTLELDTDERLAMIGIVAVGVGSLMLLTCAIAYLAIKVKKAIRAAR